MSEQHRPDELARLRAEFTAFRATIERRERRRHIARRFLPLALAAVLVALVPLATLAANPFTDLTGGPHDGNIDLIYNAGITRGCDPDKAYCPTGNVTREEMASFLARTAGLGTNPPVVNAATAVNATNAAQLGGQPAGAYALKSDIPANAIGSATIRQVSTLVNPASAATAAASVSCNAGERATGGGYTLPNGNFNGVADDRPLFAPATTVPTGWYFALPIGPGAAGQVTVYAICVPAP